MNELKEKIHENGIDYILVGDYYIPNLRLPEENRSIVYLGQLRKDYLRQVHPARYQILFLRGED